MNIREALIMMTPSLVTQRAAADEISRLDVQISGMVAKSREQEIYIASLLVQIENLKKESNGPEAVV